MKITNKNTIHLLFTLYSLFLFALIGSLITIKIFLFNISNYIEYFICASTLFNLIKIFQLKYVEYENSGEVLSLKTRYIFREQNRKNQIEVPLNKIHKISIQKAFYYKYIAITIEKENAKAMKIHFPINYVKRADLIMVEKYFQSKKLYP